MRLEVDFSDAEYAAFEEMAAKTGISVDAFSANYVGMVLFKRELELTGGIPVIDVLESLERCEACPADKKAACKAKREAKTTPARVM
jgi:hypothetical protein